MTDEASNAQRAAPRLSSAQHLAPLLWLAALFATLFALRQLSPHLDIDEAHFLGPGQLTFALGYDGSQPPLFNWLLTVAVWVTGGDLVLAVSGVRFGLNFAAWALTYLLVVAITGKRVTGWIAVAVLQMMPQIVWQMQITLTHSVLVHTAAVASLTMLHMAWSTRAHSAYVGLGCALAAGILAKYSFLVPLALAAVAIASSSALRARLSASGLVVTAITALALVAPHGLWAFANWQSTAARLDRIQTAQNANFDVPYLGVDGLLTLGWSVFMNIGVALAIWVVVIWVAGRRARPTERDVETPAATATATVRIADSRAADVAAWRDGLARILLFGLGGMAVGILLADVHRVEPRYLIPLCVAFAPWLALRLDATDIPRAGVALGLRVALVLAVALPIIFALKITSGSDRLSLPYERIARDIAIGLTLDGDRPVTLIARRQVTGANIARQLPTTAIGRAVDAPPAHLVLVSHHRKDRAWLSGLAQRLTACGFAVTPRPPRAIPYVHGVVMRRTSPFAYARVTPPDTARGDPLAAVRRCARFGSQTFAVHAQTRAR
ncbi:MAG: glycosyltransferase family 39 protein [Pseudomonadota bacterium]